MKYFSAFAVCSFSLSACVLSARPVRTFCNPLDLDYHMQKDCPHREGADPEIILHANRYWLFASKCNGYYVSDDLIHWQLIHTNDLPLDEWAPTVVEIKGKLYFSARAGTVFRAVDLLAGRWEKCAVPAVPSCDSALFRDEDGRLYDYWGACPASKALMVCELDSYTFKVLGEMVSVITPNPKLYGWNVCGDANELFNKGAWSEGSHMAKRQDRYYFQYAAPGTQYATYCDVAFIGSTPKGPFVRQTLNPFSFKPTGYVKGAGHGKTFADRYGNWWHVTTCVIAGVNRRIILMPVFFMPDGEMWCDTAFADWPIVVPDYATTNPRDFRTSWMPLSYGTPVRVSSGSASNVTYALTDERMGSAWAATTCGTNEYAILDFGDPIMLNALQIGFDDKPVEVWRDVLARRAYRVDVSLDGCNWKTLLSGTGADREHPYWAFEKALTAVALRVVPTELPAGAHFALREIRAFGKRPAPLLKASCSVMVVRDAADRRHVHVSWSPVADAKGYLVRYGPSKDKQFLSYMVRGKTSCDIRALDTAVEYSWSVTPFNEGGIQP